MSDFIVEYDNKLKVITIDEIIQLISDPRRMEEFSDKIKLMLSTDVVKTTDLGLIEDKLPAKVFVVDCNNKVKGHYEILDINDLIIFDKEIVRTYEKLKDNIYYIVVSVNKVFDIQRICDKKLWREILEENSDNYTIFFNRRKIKFEISN